MGLQWVLQVIVTDKLRSDAAAKREITPGVEHRQSRYLNRRVEVSHQPTRRRERQRQRFKSVRHAQRRAARAAAFGIWRDIAAAAMRCCRRSGR
jgi:transposase-like protein